MSTYDDLPLFASRPDAASNRSSEVIPVSALNRRVRNLLEANLELLWVSGELSNVMRAASGHWYFSLKDDAAQVRCVMFRSRASTVSFTPENGMQVEVRALPSLYEARGEFQLGVENMRRAGLGALFEAFERLKAKLSAEGLFDAAQKKTLPTFPRCIGVVTSPNAAALRDVLTTLQRRAPMIPVVLYPTSVQGAAAPAEIVAAINAATTRNEVDVLIVCRGGGSIEDLWAFNDEAVVRAIARLRNTTDIVVVAGVGHETDFTIADFVADERAPTPTAAAELVSPNREELLSDVVAMKAALQRAMVRQLDTAQQRLDRATRGLISPAERLARERERINFARTKLRHVLHATRDGATHQLALLRQRFQAQHPETVRQRLCLRLDERGRALKISMQREMERRSAAVAQAATSLALLSPLNVLERGYGIVQRGGAVVRDPHTLRVGDAITVRVAKGEIGAAVTKVHTPTNPDNK